MKKGYIILGVLTGLVVSATILILSKRLRLSSFKKRLISNANREWKLWGEQTRVFGPMQNTGSRECDSVYRDRVGEYWKKGTGRNLDGCDRGVPWSAAFISFVMKKSGAGNHFKYSSGHSTYIRDTIQNRKRNKKAPFKGYKLSEKPVELGDLVCYTRQNNVNYDTTHSYKSHCDIVVNVNKKQGFAEVIGGNVTDGVTKRVVKVDSKGYLRDTTNDWFSIIKNYM